MIWRSMVAPTVNIDFVPSGFRNVFSGECDGLVTRRPCSSGTRKSSRKRAAPRITG
jgi:hypothetical protein